MKPTSKISACLLFALAISAQAATIVTYSEDFDSNSTSTNRSLEWLTDNRPVGNWNANYSTAATTYDRTLNTSANSPVVSGVSDIIFITTTNTNNNGVPIFVWTDSLSVGAASLFDSVQFTMLNSNTTTENVRITLQIAGAWFVTNSTFNGGSHATILSTAGSTWSTLNFTSGSSMSIGSTTTLPTAGQITGVGLYDENRSDTIRFDNLSIHIIPEPSGALLLCASGFIILLRRRRS